VLAGPGGLVLAVLTVPAELVLTVLTVPAELVLTVLTVPAELVLTVPGGADQGFSPNLVNVERFLPYFATFHWHQRIPMVTCGVRS